MSQADYTAAKPNVKKSINGQEWVWRRVMWIRIDPWLKDMFTALLMGLCCKVILSPQDVVSFLSASCVMIALLRTR